MTWLVRLIGLVTLLLLGASCGKAAGPAEGSGDEGAPGAARAGTPAAALPAQAPAGGALRIAYSDWPGWVAWEIALQKGWFKEAGVEVDFTWFEYVPSMEAYSAGKVDAVCVTNGDALVTGNGGAPSVGVLVNDYSNGNDMVVARPGITRVAELKGKKVGVEVGFVGHLLLLNALRSAGLGEKDIQIVNVPTDQTPQTLRSGAVDAIVAWQPNSGQALRELPGSTAIFTSADAPGIIYDLLAVSPKSLAERRADWVKVVKVWDRVARFIKDEKNLDEAVRLMSARVGLSPEQYRPLLSGTFFLDLAGGMKHLEKGDGLASLHGSSKIVDEFNVKNSVYKAPLKVEDYIDSSLTAEALAAGQAP
ncbi:ABC transporter substrate-binding protein [Sorangium sp. So ce1097]|uniref:ABC transporter substrate-binding protein n=1 Tax=Sorangium sp. So ce1097 TaxID=3133330 RepID=UPI003F5E5397